MPTLKCMCGAEILSVPDLKAMNRAIEEHIAEHRKTGGQCEKRDAMSDYLRQTLFEQLFEITAVESHP